MAWWWIKSVLKRRNLVPVAGLKQPRPVFFSEEEINRMNKVEGSYQFKGGHYGEKTEADGY